MTPGDLWRLSLENLWRTKLRSVLTMLGVVIGIGALVSMLGLGAVALTQFGRRPYPYTALAGTVQTIAAVARQTPGQQSLSFLVKILLDEQRDLKILPGMSVRADIYTQSSEETLAVPIQAVRYDDEADEDSGEGDQGGAEGARHVHEAPVARADREHDELGGRRRRCRARPRRRR